MEIPEQCIDTILNPVRSALECPISKAFTVGFVSNAN